MALALIPVQAMNTGQYCVGLYTLPEINLQSEIVANVLKSVYPTGDGSWLGQCAAYVMYYKYPAVLPFLGFRVCSARQFGG